MSQVLDLTEYRSKVLEQRAFGPWRKRFGESYGAGTRLADLSDKTLYFLAMPGEETARAYYEFIMGILDLGEAPKFYYLDDKDQLRVTDVHFFLVDQVRFELIRRLGWITGFPGEDHTLLEMAQTFEKAKAWAGQEPVALSESHPEYNAYNKLIDAEKQIFIRRKLLKAMEEFRSRMLP